MPSLFGPISFNSYPYQDVTLSALVLGWSCAAIPGDGGSIRSPASTGSGNKKAASSKARTILERTSKRVI
jgi:hypothetical protein